MTWMPPPWPGEAVQEWSPPAWAAPLALLPPAHIDVELRQPPAHDWGSTLGEAIDHEESFFGPDPEDLEQYPIAEYDPDNEVTRLPAGEVLGPLPPIPIDVGEEFVALYDRSIRYVIRYGGRGAMKSWSFAQAVVVLAHTGYERILCAREFQNSMADSVYRVIVDTIDRLGLSDWFNITKTSIVSRVTGSEFMFKGLRRHIEEIKSTEGVTICWVEEARSVSEDSWSKLIPTIRKVGSRVFISFNTDQIDDATYKRYVLEPPPNASVVKINYDKNPYLSQELRDEMEYCKRTDPEMYNWVWLGFPRLISEAVIFKGRYRIARFERPAEARPLIGFDWGFAVDPTCGIEFFTYDNRLWIEFEVYGVGVELEDLVGLGPTKKALLLQLPSVKTWPSKGDGSRPETISYVKRNGKINLSAAEKWPGSVEDGVTHMKGAFTEIVIHERCVRTIAEFGCYSYKVDDNGDILPVIVDKNNHCIDAIRYGLDGFIRGRGQGHKINPALLHRAGTGR